ncbi:MAG TPA: thioredoxin-disulfide reductase [Dictyoglomaceae bacterium]|nr:thioredoxin-disulfide reductase [Dictyoglomaceae bacterium]HOL38993.1 thioredoxin-disulfide reductase [Dictyoglomaceae bacterium]HOP94332.1 thioredoxin-disulfide reductase [Dictyoglomaceae bacterium]HPP15831.1 thioredoxin-disulfide reductase [Dictyoglomaceae bacterium]HPU42820.1 thioredoxin-disulfide reductase [Dictyoglomaceae bacterium]
MDFIALTRTEEKIDTEQDVIILGGGPAGLTAGIYAGRNLLKTLIIEKTSVGGNAILTEKIDNYPGFPEGITGEELAKKMETQAKKFGVKILESDVQRIYVEGYWKIIETSNGTYRSLSLIIATGTRPRRLEVPGEDKLRGKGVSYCAVCDGAFFTGKKVAVVGGGDSALEEAIYLTKFAEDVTIIHRRDTLRAERIVQQKAFSNSKIKFLWSHIIKAIEGEKKVERLILEDLKTHEIKTFPVDGVFIYVGLIPNTELFKGILNLDPNGFIITDEKMQTSVPGIYAAGDVRGKVLRQLVTAVADGAVAAIEASKFLEEINNKEE